MVGQTVGKYRVEDRIGRGGMGTVYRAVDSTLHREVAIKVLNSELNDPEVAKRFRAEAITVARLSHPGIATVYELFEHDGQWLMVMEFVRGETLERLIERAGPLSAERASDLIMQALSALQHAHSLGVVHRDLKPANLMLTDQGAVKIMDFGIARVSGSEHLTSAGFMMGTPAYMAPEQVLGQEVDARADLYAMGVVLYRLVTAKLPFKGETPFALAQSQVNDPPTPLRIAREGLPAWIEQVVSRSLAKSPGDRFQTADQFREVLKRCLAGLPMEMPSDAAAPTGMLLTPPGLPTGSFAPRTPTGTTIPPVQPVGPATAGMSGMSPSPMPSSGTGAVPAGTPPASGAVPMPNPAYLATGFQPTVSGPQAMPPSGTGPQPMPSGAQPMPSGAQPMPPMAAGMPAGTGAQPMVTGAQPMGTGAQSMAAGPMATGPMAMGTGAQAMPAPMGTGAQPMPVGTGAQPVVPMPAPMPPPAPAKAAPTKPAAAGPNMAVIGAVALVVLLLGGGGFLLWRKQHAQPPVDQTPPVTTTDTPPPSAPPPAPPDASAANPSASAAGASTPPATSGPPAATPTTPPPTTTATPTAAGTTGAGTKPATPATGATTTGAGPTSTGAGAPNTTGARGASTPTTAGGTTTGTGREAGGGTTGRGANAGPIDDSFLSVKGMKYYAIAASGTSNKDAVANFGAGHIAIAPKDGGAALATIPYKQLVKATYIHANNPRWDQALPGPPDNVKIEGGGIFKGKENWIVLQTKTDYVVLRLDDSIWLHVIETIEARTPVKVDRLDGGL